MSRKRRIYQNLTVIDKTRRTLIESDLFNILPGKEILALSQQFTSLEYKKSQYIFHQDDHSDHLYLILEGSVIIEKLTLEGKTTRVTTLGSGDIFGEFSLLDSNNRSASAISKDRSLVASLNARYFNLLLELYPQFSKNLLKLLVRRLRETSIKLENLTSLNLMQRLIFFLFEAKRISGSVVNITQSDLAQQLFVTREKLNIKLKELERLGVIKIGHGEITIVDLNILK